MFRTVLYKPIEVGTDCVMFWKPETYCKTNNTKWIL